MSEPTSSAFGIFRALGFLLTSLRRKLAHKFLIFQPSLEGGKRHSFYPRDFLDKVKLGSSRNKILSMLGEPDQENDERWTYSYKEVHLQLVFYGEGGSLRTVVLGFRGRPGKDNIKISWLNQPLGKLTLADAIDYCEEGRAALDGTIGMRHQEITINERLGPPNAYQYITFGALDPIIGDLTQSEFTLDPTSQVFSGDPSTVLVNWIALSAHGFDNNYFDWTVTVPSY